MSRRDPGDHNGVGVTRRQVLVASATLVATSSVTRAVTPEHRKPSPGAAQPHATGLPYRPVVVPNGTKLPWKMVGGWKVFHLVAEEVVHAFAPGLEVFCWGYNGAVHGPVIEAVDGDRVRIYVTNRLPAATTVHWHGVLLPNGMDGVGGLTQRAIKPGETFKYEFALRQTGLLMYHSHHDEMVQMALGMTGLFVIHPRGGPDESIDHDFALLLHEWRVDVGTARPTPMEMTDFNMLTMNAKAFPGTQPLVVRTGDRVRIRLGNLSATNHHPIHVHGHHFHVTETDGGRIPPSAQWPESTVLVPVGSTRTIEFVADAPGDWAIHCHMTHHVMNQMGHDIPNMIGVRTEGIDERLKRVLPGYMSMGTNGMAEMASEAPPAPADVADHGAHEEHGAMPGMQMSEGEGMTMPVPPNSIPMLGARGRHDTITMGGMFTVLKVRDRIEGTNDPGWYENPHGTLAVQAAPEELRRDGVTVAPRPEGDPG